MEKTTRYNGKTLNFKHNPDGSKEFNTTDFFNILGVKPDDYIDSSQTEFITYQAAIKLADRIDEVFAQWLSDNYAD